MANRKKPNNKPTNNRSGRDNRTSKPSQRNTNGRGKTDRTGDKSEKNTEERIEKVQKGKSDYNDLTYYFKSPELLNSVANISFQNFLGLGAAGKYEVPTIMTLMMNPSPGLTYQNSTPALSHPDRVGVNLASVKLFSKLSMGSGRNMQYAPQDIATCILAMSQLLAIHSYVRRLFGSIRLAQPWNRMYPKACIEAMGIDYDDFIEHWQDYLGYYNAEIAAVNQLPILSTCGYLTKCMTQFDYIFTDDESPLAQHFIYVPYSTWIIDEQSYSGGTVLRTTPVIGDGTTTTPQKRTFSWLMINVIRPMINALLTSSTLNLVYADMLKLSSTDSTFTFYHIPMIDETYVVEPVKQPEALLHIHNSRAMTVPPTINNNYSVNTYTPYNDVYPDANKNNLIYNPGFETVYQLGATYQTGDQAPWEIVVDSPIAEPTPGLVAEMTRYTSCLTNNFWADPNDGNRVFSVFNLLTDWYIVCYCIYSNDTTTPALLGNTYEIANKATIQAIGVSEKYSQFDWHPIVSYFDKSDPHGEIVSIQGDLNFYTMVPKTWFERVNAAVYLGLFEF